MTYNIIEEVEHQPGKVVTVKKQVWDSSKQEFVTKRFIRYYRNTQSEIDQDCTTLTKAYGLPQYQGMWWVEHSRRYVWLAESAATFWTLKNT